MSLYSTARSGYLWADRAVLCHLPGHARVRLLAWRAVHILLPDHAGAHSEAEFMALSAQRASAGWHLPDWVVPEVTELAKFEPMLNKLVGPRAKVEPYFIPWDQDYIGRRYADARRQLRGPYACMVLSGAGATAVDMPMLYAAPRPLVVIDVVGDVRLAALARAAGAEYLALPAEHLDADDHCAVMARLVLQLAPGEVLPTPHPAVVRCIERHGRALATVTRLRPLPVHAGMAAGTGFAGTPR